MQQVQLFNGNSEMYSDFINEDGEHFFNQNYDITKWERAKTASLDAINTAIENGVGLYEFISTPPGFEEDFDDNSYKVCTIQNIRLLINGTQNLFGGIQIPFVVMIGGKCKLLA